MENDEKIRRLAVSILAAVEQDRRAGGNKADAAKQWLAGPRALFWARVACGDTGRPQSVPEKLPALAVAHCATPDQNKIEPAPQGDKCEYI